MRAAAKLITIYLILAAMWFMLEIEIYGCREPRAVDNIMVCAYGWAMAYSYQTGKGENGK